MSNTLGAIIGILVIGGWVLIPLTYNLIRFLILEIINIPRVKKNLEQSIEISEKIPADKIVHFLSFYTSKAKELEPKLNKDSLLQNIAQKGNDDGFWESLLYSSNLNSAEQIVDKYLSHEKYSHLKQQELKLKKIFIPD